MNCNQFNKMMDDYIDGALSTIQLGHMQPHLNHCEKCRHLFTQAQSLTMALKNITVPPAKAGYEQRMLTFLENKPAQKTHFQNWLVAGFGSAIAATFTLWLTFSPQSTLSTNAENVASINLFVKKEKTVDLIFNLPNELAEATLTIELPDKVEVSGYPGKRQLSWNTSFKKGANRLALPIIASEANKGFLIARLKTKGTTKIFRVKIDSMSAPTSMLIRHNNTIAII